MGWQGIEWVLPVYGIGIVVLPVVAFIVIWRRVKRGTLAKLRAFLYYAGLVLTLPILYVAFFFAMVGIEELTRAAIVTEGLGRTFLPAVGLGVMLWLLSAVVFGMTLLWTSK
jgi:hypothetical protein